MSDHAFRFGYQLRSRDADELLADAVAAEAAGFDVIHTFDHVDAHWPPLAPLAAIAGSTTRIRLCPLVINNDFRHPVLSLARSPLWTTSRAAEWSWDSAPATRSLSTKRLASPSTRPRRARRVCPRG